MSSSIKNMQDMHIHKRALIKWLVQKALRSIGHIKFRQLLRDIRKERGLTQIQLAEKIERDQSFVSRYEAGDKILDIVELREICLALEIPLEKFVRRWEKLLEKESKK